MKDARKFLGLDEKGGYHLPGFHLEAVQFLREERRVNGIATDTLNLDAALAGDFPVHHYIQTNAFRPVDETGASPDSSTIVVSNCGGDIV